MSQSLLWILFGAVVAAILVFDLFVLGRRRRGLETRRAVLIVAVYVALAFGFGLVVLASLGSDRAMEFYTAYVLEQSLSFDNILVWLLIFKALQVPKEAEQKVLFWGILGAMAFRGLFIFAGTALLNSFDWLLYVFGALVILTGVRLLTGSGGTKSAANSRILRFISAHLPMTRSPCDGRFFQRDRGRIRATSLLLALLVIEATDLMFALDSIPAILGVTRDPFIVYTSNIFAIVGLRALFFAIEGLVDQLRYLRYGLALLLTLIGLKMIGGHFVEVPVWITFAATATILAATVGASLLASARDSGSAGR